MRKRHGMLALGWLAASAKWPIMAIISYAAAANQWQHQPQYEANGSGITNVAIMAIHHQRNGVIHQLMAYQLSINMQKMANQWRINVSISSVMA